MNNTDKTEFLNTIPERLISWEKDSEKNLAVLFVPRFRKGLLKKWLQPRLKRPYIRVTLDEIGSMVWENCDGKKSVREIANILEGHFGERVKPAEERLKLFFNTLYRSQFVRYWQIQSSSETTPATSKGCCSDERTCS